MRFVLKGYRKDLVPAHTGGADLSKILRDYIMFKPVPAHTGGADLSDRAMPAAIKEMVPAHTGGADLSLSYDLTD